MRVNRFIGFPVLQTVTHGITTVCFLFVKRKERKTMKTKKIVSIVLAAALLVACVLSLSACGEKKVYTVGICQLVRHDALDAATKGFKDALTKGLSAKKT